MKVRDETNLGLTHAAVHSSTSNTFSKHRTTSCSASYFSIEHTFQLQISCVRMSFVGDGVATEVSSLPHTHSSLLLSSDRTISQIDYQYITV